MAMQVKSSASRFGVLARAPGALPRFEPRTALARPTVDGRQLFAPLRPSKVLQQPQTRETVVASATDAAFDEGLTGKDDYSPLIGVAAFVAVWFNKLQVDRVKLLQALAFLQLFTAAVNIITRRGVGDSISKVVSPTVLAVAVLSIRHVTYLDAATALFGYLLSENLEAIYNVPFYVFLATLAAALYTGYGTLWYVAAFGVASAGKVYKSSSNKEAVPVIVIPGILAAIFAIWKEAHFPLALSLYLAQTVWSGLGAVDALTKRVKD